MPTISLNGHAIYYELTGHGDQTLLLFNGITMSTATWMLMSPQLETHYQLLRLDFLGQGQSDKPNVEYYPLAEQADIAYALLNALGLTRVHLAGLSYGGIVAQYFARRYPQMLQTLLLASTLAWSDHANAAISDSWTAANAVGGVDLRYTVSIPWLFSSRYLGEHGRTLAEFKVLAEFVEWPAVVRLINGVKQHDARTWLEQITTHTHVLVGSEDRLTPLYQSQTLVSHLPNASLQVLPGAGHVLHIEAADAFTHAIMAVCRSQ